MRGRQLRAFKGKKKAISLKPFPDVSIRGKAEELLYLSPREKQQEAQNYLKNVSNLKNIVPLITTATQSESITQLNTEYFPKQETEKVRNQSTRRQEKDPPLNINSKFSQYLRRLQEEKFRRINKELFPEELCEEIEYLPDCFQSTLKEPLSLESSTLSQKFKSVQYKTVKNVTRSSFFSRNVNPEVLDKSKFTTYNVDWRVNKSETGSIAEKKNIFPALTERGSKSTERRQTYSQFNNL